MRIHVPPPSSANGRVEAEAEWASGVNGGGSPGGRKWKWKEKALEPIEEGGGAATLFTNSEFDVPVYVFGGYVRFY